MVFGGVQCYIHNCFTREGQFPIVSIFGTVYGDFCGVVHDAMGLIRNTGYSGLISQGVFTIGDLAAVGNGSGGHILGPGPLDVIAMFALAHEGVLQIGQGEAGLTDVTQVGGHIAEAPVLGEFFVPVTVRTHNEGSVI